ncbi:glycerol-3-phosphate dehydrogenase/oxidase [Frigoribacterium sp. CFBP 13712]|uniref:glycerol-3-phosphate dehydrogenase/oxidase n=1 Tax=Frigoribacterium sp. CFBP 13712 TaxID=2775309 RepID=UPI001785293D|nr:glycerol-3-phosphate dehydrogenase/oxidase [Frigoribacterium sp. CFBP 13712]MBD8704223.1 glycerol-3-phosphate dehydrogenase/oxidase [Frigoribacterium sp. CFBP 13712]
MARSASVSLSTKLGPDERAAAVEVMKTRELDILVIGGGIVGAGSALDAVTRGLSVGIVEARDWGSGTSSRSSKLVHGGIRYLEQLNFRLVREALIERGLLLQRLAPHLVKPVRFLYPLSKPVYERFYIGAGMALYDIFSWTGGRPPGVPHHRHLTKTQVMRAIPSLSKDAVVGGLTYYDAQVDDARYVSSLVRTASAYGAHAASRIRVEGFVKVGERVVGVKAHDYQTGEHFEIRAKQVVNATGVWTDDTQAMVGERGQFKVRASKGVHLVVPRDRIHSDMGMIFRTEKSVLFVIPWGRHWLVGTTDTDWDLDKAHPAATAADIDYILEHVNKVMAVPLTRDDVEGVYAGLRPLLAGESDQTSKLSREHIVAHTVPGLVVVAGGKWTTYRVMAEDAIDEAVAALDGRIPSSTTMEIPLIGAEGYHAAWNKRGKIAKAFGVHKVRIEHLLNRYGTTTDEILDLIRDDPSLAEPLPGADDYIRAEVVYAASHESALHLEDVLARRTRISIEAWDRGESAAPVAAKLMAGVIGWSDDEAEAEVANYLKRVAAERASQLEPDDESADRVRLEAPDIAFGFEEDDMVVPGADQGGAPKPDENVVEPAGTPGDDTSADRPGGSVG